MLPRCAPKHCAPRQLPIGRSSDAGLQHQPAIGAWIVPVAVEPLAILLLHRCGTNNGLRSSFNSGAKATSSGIRAVPANCRLEQMQQRAAYSITSSARAERVGAVFAAWKRAAREFTSRNCGVMSNYIPNWTVLPSAR